MPVRPDALVAMPFGMKPARRDPFDKGAIESYTSAFRTDPSDYYSGINAQTLGNLEVLVGTPPSVAVAYLEAVGKNHKDCFPLHSSRAQLHC
jgi:hypothetical protein